MKSVVNLVRLVIHGCFTFLSFIIFSFGIRPYLENSFAPVCLSLLLHIYVLFTAFLYVSNKLDSGEREGIAWIFGWSMRIIGIIMLFGGTYLGVKNWNAFIKAIDSPLVYTLITLFFVLIVVYSSAFLANADNYLFVNHSADNYERMSKSAYSRRLSEIEDQQRNIKNEKAEIAQLRKQYAATEANTKAKNPTINVNTNVN